METKGRIPVLKVLHQPASATVEDVLRVLAGVIALGSIVVALLLSDLEPAVRVLIGFGGCVLALLVLAWASWTASSRAWRTS